MQHPTRLLVLALATAWMTALGPAASAAPGDLDPTFSGDGKQTVNAGGSEEAYAVAVRPDGRIVIAGATDAGGSADFLVIQLEADGDPDPTFGGGDGIVTTDFFGGYDVVEEIRLLPSGKILAVGAATDGSGKYRFAFARYRPSGALDTSFGSGGKRTVRFARTAYGRSLVPLPDGSHVAAGVTGSPKQDLALTRIKKNGALDTRFGKNGRVVTDFAHTDLASTVARQGDRILVAGGVKKATGFFDSIVARYRFDGSLDRSFGRKGRKQVSFHQYGDWINDLVVLPNRRFVVAAYAHDDTALGRYLPRGRLDPAFGGGDGKVLEDLGNNDGAEAIARSGGKLVVAGWAWPGGAADLVVSRFTGLGAFDTGFGTGGTTTADYGASNTAAWDVAVTDLGIVAVGYQETPGGDVVVARFLS